MATYPARNPEQQSRLHERLSVGALGGISLLFAILFTVVPILNSLIVGASLVSLGFCMFIFVMNETLHPQEHPYHDALNIAKTYFGLLLLGLLFTFLDRVDYLNAIATVTWFLTAAEVVGALALFACTAILYSQYQDDLRKEEK